MKTTRFFAAIQSGKLDEVREMIREEPDLAAARNESGVSALLTALYHGQHAILEELRRHDPPLTLWEAAGVGDVERVTAILDAEPELLDQPAPDGFSAAGLAAFFGRVEVLRALIARGADIDQPAQNPLQVRPIHSAVAHRQPETALTMATMLLEAGAAVNVAQQGGWTPLHQAAAHGHEAMITQLLAHGASRTARGDDGRTPLDMAVGGGHEAAAALLREDE